MFTVVLAVDYNKVNNLIHCRKAEVHKLKREIIIYDSHKTYVFLVSLSVGKLSLSENDDDISIKPLKIKLETQI